jgi:hypothetical protein
MGATPKPRIKLAPKPKDHEESGLWVNAELIAKIHGLGSRGQRVHGQFGFASRQSLTGDIEYAEG